MTIYILAYRRLQGTIKHYGHIIFAADPQITVYVNSLISRCVSFKIYTRYCYYYNKKQYNQFWYNFFSINSLFHVLHYKLIWILGKFCKLSKKTSSRIITGTRSYILLIYLIYRHFSKYSLNIFIRPTHYNKFKITYRMYTNPWLLVSNFIKR